MTTRNKILSLVSRGYKTAAFANKSNALYFKHLWERRGYKVTYMHSSGPTVEGIYKRNAYYMMAKKHKKGIPTRRIVHRRRQSYGLLPRINF